MIRTTDITSFTRHRQNLRDHLEQVRESGRPLYVTTNGRTDAVVLSPETFDRLVAKAELADSLDRIDRGMEDYRAGRAQPLREAVEEIAEELELNLDR